MYLVKKIKGVFNAFKSQPDICNGPLVKTIIVYTIPIIASGVLQLAFNAADSIIVGRFAENGDMALAAVGSTGSLVTLLVNLLTGLSIGASVVVSHAWGAGDKRGISHTVHTTMLTSLAGGILFGVFGYFVSNPCLKLMGTPDEVIGLATTYMQIYFIGLPAIMVYTFASAIIRSTGDSKRPLYFLLIGGVINVALNLVLVIGFHMTVEGVAIATVVSQLVSAIFSVVHLMKIDGPQRLYLNKLKIHLSRFKKILIIGLPAGIQGAVFSISTVLIQSSVNSFGSVCVTGNSAASNIEGFIYIAMNGFYHTALTFVGQHIGARKPERLRKVVTYCVIMVASIGLIFGVGAYIFAKPLLEIYIPDNREAVAYGVERMMIICTTYVLCGIMDTMIGCLRGFGASISPLIISIVGVCVLRTVWIYTVFPIYNTPTMLYMCFPVSWAVTIVAQFICYFVVKKKTFERLDAMSLSENY